ncbi:MAG: ABC transporter substrate-binding protein, partial [Solirubrobacterales bacterium]|nr:ABC transporter substrate-binding protein [Solirubrobacterales bacterium]
MRIELARRRSRWFLIIALVAGMSLFVAACGSDDDDGGGGDETTAESGEATAEAPKCGLGNGEEATGEPIKLGAIATKQPGTDFSDIPNTASAFFECVNDNGGINGHPVEHIVETEQTDPGQDAALARKLIEDDGVAGIVGSTSLIECDVNHEYYEQQGFYVINSGIAPTCWSTPNSAPVNMGPRY